MSNDIADINDMRGPEEFKGISFSKYKKTDVRKELLNSLLECKIEHACNWSGELICAGHYLDLWDIIITFLSKHVHLANPKLSIYVEMRYEQFKEIMNGGFIGNELRMRNNQNIRNLFAELICILCNTNKKHSYQGVKINKEQDFDMVLLSNKLKAPTIEYAEAVYLKGDPRELFISINEFAYHISVESKSKDGLLACYWLEWIMEFQTICKNKKTPCLCERRNFNVDEKYQLDPIWILWEIILQNSEKKDKISNKIINSLISLYCLKFTPGVKKKRRYLIYFAISILTEKFDSTIEIIQSQNKEIIENVIKKINSVYKQIKKNEICPQTDYLMADVKKSSLDKTIGKLDKINSMDLIIRR